MMDNRSLLEKADLQLSDLLTDGGLLTEAQAMKFLRVMIDQAVVTKIATVKPMKSHKEEIDKIQFASRILRAGSEGIALAESDRAKPTTDKVELDAQLFKAEVRLTNEVLEDNIERGTLRQTVMTLMAERIATDMDEVVVNGDTTSTDPFLAQFDGILKQSTSNTVDAAGARLTKTVLKDTFRAMPNPFRKGKRLLRFLTSSNAEIDYRDSLSDRATEVGDRALINDQPIGYSGIPVLDVDVMPEDQGTGDKTSVILTNPKNINVGIWRQIRIETDKLIREGVMLIVASLRFDCKYAHEPATVKTYNVLAA